MEELLFTLDEDDSIYTSIIKTNLKDRRIILNAEVDDSLLEQISIMMLHWNAEDKNLPVESRKKIYLYINSIGGDVIMGMNILSVIKSSVTPVVTVGFSKCYSMGSYILAAGHERYAFPYTAVLYHDGQSGYYTSSNKGKDIQKFYDKIESKLVSFITDRTNMDPEFLEKIKDREYYMFAEEAKEHGIIDKIIGVDCQLDEIL